MMPPAPFPGFPSPHSSSADQGVNGVLTPKRRKRAVENDEYAAFILRILRAYARRVAKGDIDAVAEMVTVASAFDVLIREAVQGLHAKGYSWAEIAQRLGVTRQAAHQRWGSRA